MRGLVAGQCGEDCAAAGAGLADSRSRRVGRTGEGAGRHLPIVPHLGAVCGGGLRALGQDWPGRVVGSPG